jgi:hypothetical protein
LSLALVYARSRTWGIVERRTHGGTIWLATPLAVAAGKSVAAEAAHRAA